nr:Hypothetical FlmD [Moritella viscosa]SHO05413.1 Hypothetical FlmD [Moritella viscosa]SHO12456.1 Hypothetical FlmD [Moritella viscosa]
MSADLVIVDHYALNKDWQSRVRNDLDCKIFVIDQIMLVANPLL